MKFLPTALAGAYLIDIEPINDERGFFTRNWCRREFERHGLDTEHAQSSISFNKKCGTLRGLHYQIKPHEETKVVRCTAGSIYDVIIDLRPESSTYMKWISFELSAENRRMIYIPHNFAHGFQTLSNNTEVLYQISESHHPESSKSIRWDDPTFSIKWPPAERTISERDKSHQNYAM